VGNFRTLSTGDSVLCNPERIALLKQGEWVGVEGSGKGSEGKGIQFCILWITDVTELAK